MKKCQFLTLWISCFYSVQRRFFVQEYHKRHFPSLYYLKNKSWKNGYFWGKTIWKIVNFSTFWTSSFYSLARPFFVLECHKRNFPGLFCLKKIGKMAIFRAKPWVNPFQKMSIIRLFKRLFFYSLERRFFVVEYHKRHFPGLNRL